MLLASIFEAKLETVLMGKSGNWKPSKSEDRLDWHSKAIVSVEIRMKIRLSGLPVAINMGIAKYSWVATYEVLREKAEEVAWWRLLWFQHTIPKHSTEYWPYGATQGNGIAIMCSVEAAMRVEITYSSSVHLRKESSLSL